MADTTEDAHRNLADDTRFRPLNEQHERYYYTDPETGESRWLRLREALAKKAELDKTTLDDADAVAGENG